MLGVGTFDHFRRESLALRAAAAGAEPALLPYAPPPAALDAPPAPGSPLEPFGAGTGLSLPGQRPLEVGGARAAARGGAAAARGAAEVVKSLGPAYLGGVQIGQGEPPLTTAPRARG